MKAMWSLMLKLSDSDFIDFIRNIRSLSVKMYISVVEAGLAGFIS